MVSRFAPAIALLQIFMLAACGATPQEPATPTAPAWTETPTATATNTPTPTIIPTPTNTPGPSPTPLPTPSFESTMLGDNLLFGGRSPDCELPCWYGLTPGESDYDDIERVFNTTLGFGGTFDLMADAVPSTSIPDLLIAGNQWIFRETETYGEDVSVRVWFPESPQRLEAVIIDPGHSRFRPYTTPQRVLREMGVPSYMMVNLQYTESTAWSVLRLFIIYEEGVTIHYPTVLVPTFPSQQVSLGIRRFCLNQIVYELEADVDIYHSEIYLTEPFTPDLDQLSPFQEYFVGRMIDLTFLEPFEEVFGVTLEEVTQMAMEQDNACLYEAVP